ncbi:hypothetical protein BC670_0267 [Flavobacterium branchiophilum]|uniref:Uncharacterized protein n=2 Tax=Flavobacterium branchiophilum TaxID=55197 RepID=A0A543G066_9FLAO|nr:hypothetical protein BC670_0267 [Flavobacterium branchiophilum]
MTAVNGGSFWNGFAAGALSSIASSAWSGGETITDNGNYTMSMTKHAGLGAGTGDIGTIAFGTLSGGAGAALTGGNFWQGAVTGLVVSGLNHTFHGTKNKEYTRRDVKIKDGKIIGEKLIYFKNNTKEKLLYNQALSEPIKTNVLSIYAHGNVHNVNYYTTIGGVESMLINDSSMWQDFKKNGGTLTIDLKSCNTGILSNKINISQHLTYLNEGLTIYAPANYWLYNGEIRNNAGYNKFYEGEKTNWVQNR